MLVAAAVCPHPPVLVPQVAGGASGELDALRRACDDAVGRILDAGPDVLVVVGAGSATVTYDDAARGCLPRFGVDLPVGGNGQQQLPLSLTVGRWLVDRASPRIEVRLQGVAQQLSARSCATLGAGLATAAPRVALLAMGDSCATLTDRSPCHHDPRAVGWDDDVAALLAVADLSGIAALDPPLADELRAGGRPAWQVLAGAAAGQPWEAELLAREAPYGVSYLVASWRPVAPGRSPG